MMRMCVIIIQLPYVHGEPSNLVMNHYNVQPIIIVLVNRVKIVQIYLDFKVNVHIDQLIVNGWLPI